MSNQNKRQQNNFEIEQLYCPNCNTSKYVLLGLVKQSLTKKIMLIKCDTCGEIRSILLKDERSNSGRLYDEQKPKHLQYLG